ncbi:MAG: UTP--glucose-1-phosphate uridylyltransferase [Patescibacteria group bacterium]|nr:UTP--glucose-1-phosphate uridylyltransferase [Patescibacteria group bacterium]
MKIKKVLIPAAGFGTRFLPATKAMPKEMLPVVDKPIIQYVVEEAVEAGIEDVIIVTGSHKRSIEDHFDYPFELEQLLIKSHKEKELAEVRRIASLANFIYLRQKGPMGNATPILNARHVIGDEPFLVLWGDDFIEASPSRTRQLLDVFDKYGGTVLGGIRTDKEEDARRYGFAAGKMLDKSVMKVERLVEKPGPGHNLSNLATVSGFIFTPEIFEAIEEVKAKIKPESELMYIDALNILLKQRLPIFACEIKNGTFYDTGNKLEYLKTVVQFALRHKDLNGDFRKYLKGLKL